MGKPTLVLTTSNGDNNSEITETHRAHDLHYLFAFDTPEPNIIFVWISIASLRFGMTAAKRIFNCRGAPYTYEPKNIKLHSNKER